MASTWYPVPVRDEATTTSEAAAQDPPGTTGSSGGPMAELRPGDPPGAPLARARVMGALFGRDRSGAFGRFHVVKRLGAGGMGVVYEAYDPDLARGVALKLVDVSHKDRDAALAEAQMLARLSHPNVVPIYDVGLDGNHVYIVMELVRGRTLDHWPDRSSRGEVLEVYQQAGAALVAAHEAGIVHRDFKPSNAIIGLDGRVRVIDFGLACEADEPHDAPQPRAAAGTRGFMAPEIAARAAVTPNADQYSFCVALSAALEQTGQPVPRWTAAALARGRAADPTARHESMKHLLRRLARDPARARRRVVAAAAVAAAIGGAAFLVGQRRAVLDELAGCELEAQDIEAAWPAPARRTALDRVARIADDGAGVRWRLERDLDRYITRWHTETRAACRDRLAGWRAELSNLRRACLQRGRRAFEDLGDAIANAAPGDVFALQTAVVQMAEPSRCTDDALASARIASPPAALVPAIEGVRDRLEAVRTQIDRGRYAEADRDAAAAVATARTLGFDPLLAEALLVQGHARLSIDLATATAALQEAATLAMRAGKDAVAIQAWARYIYAHYLTSGETRMPAGAEVMSAFAERSPTLEFERALLYNNLGGVAQSISDRATARASYQKAVTLSAALGARHDHAGLELIQARANLALVTEDRAAADALFGQTVAELTDLLGENHPKTLDVRWMRGTTTIEPLPDAVAFLVPLCEASQRHPPSRVRAARCWTEVSYLYLDLARDDDARAAIARAAGSSPTPDTQALSALVGDRDPGRAEAAFTGLIARSLAQIAPGSVEAGAVEEWWHQVTRAELLLGLGTAQRAQGKLREASAALDQAAALLAPVVESHPGARHERLLGRARVQLALVRASLGRPRSEIAPIAGAAVAWLRKVGGPPALVTELSRLSG
jgi:predicted Ser/Thr protein kinase/tetratricopeptide (TPR) repeat protein